jgi:hypothetical protein
MEVPGRKGRRPGFWRLGGEPRVKGPVKGPVKAGRGGVLIL